MNLISRVLIMTVCVFTAYALPNLGEVSIKKENAMLKAVIAQLQNVLPRQPAANNTNNTQDACFATYSNRLIAINAETVNQTQACYESADRAIAMYNHDINGTLIAVNAESAALQRRLADCATRNTSVDVFNCNVATFDQNLSNLNNLTVRSQVAAATASGYTYEVDVARQACVGKVLIGNKSNSTSASNELQICLSNSTSGNSNSTNPGNRTLTTYLY